MSGSSIAPIGMLHITPVITKHTILCVLLSLLGTSCLMAWPANYECRGNGLSSDGDVEPVDHLGPQSHILIASLLHIDIHIHMLPPAQLRIQD